MNPEKLISAGQLQEALAAVQQEIRANPGDARLRIFLFQLLSVLGQWEKALTQLQVLRDLDADCMLLAQIFKPVVECEPLREGGFFRPARSHDLWGAGRMDRQVGRCASTTRRGKAAAARELREQAFEAAPEIPGKINDRPFQWIADADSRLGPMLEVIISGRYYWVPFFRIRSIRIEPPHDLRDMVWTTAQFTWANGGESPGLIPTRYAGTAGVADSGLRLARRTDWVDKTAETYVGLGQRILATDVEEIPLLEVRSIEFTPAAAASAD